MAGKTSAISFVEDSIMQFNHLLFSLLFCTGQALAHGSLHNQIQDLTKTMQREEEARSCWSTWKAPLGARQ